MADNVPGAYTILSLIYVPVQYGAGPVSQRKAIDTISGPKSFTLMWTKKSRKFFFNLFAMNYINATLTEISGEMSKVRLATRAEQGVINHAYSHETERSTFHNREITLFGAGNRGVDQHGVSSNIGVVTNDILKRWKII